VVAEPQENVVLLDITVCDDGSAARDERAQPFLITLAEVGVIEAVEGIADLSVAWVLHGAQLGTDAFHAGNDGWAPLVDSDLNAHLRVLEWPD